MIPKIHPLTKTFVDLRRIEQRMEGFIANFPEELMNDVERYHKIMDLILQAKALVPEDYTVGRL